MKMANSIRRKHSIENIILLLFSFSTFCNAYFCAMWSTYPYRFLTLICNYLSAVSIALVFFLLFRKGNKFRIKRRYARVLILLIITEVYVHVMGQIVKTSITLGDLLLILSAAMLLIMPEQYRKNIFEYILKLFVIMVLPSLVYYILSMVGINFPHSTLATAHKLKSLYGYYYAHYPFGLIIHDPGTIPRLCGLFDEAGFVGSISALLFVASYDTRIHKTWKVLLLIEGLMSLSLAFYVMIILFFAIRSYQKGAVKLAGFLLVLFIVGFAFTHINLPFEGLQRIQSRLNFSSNILFENNRTTVAFDNEYNQFLHGSGYAVMFGNGWDSYTLNPNMSGSYSYKCLIYDFGIIGFFIYLLPFVAYAVAHRIDKRCLPFILIFGVSIFQRPYILTVQYLTIFITALAFISSLSVSNQLEEPNAQQ